jgi:DNA-binding protein Fis
MTDQPVSRSDMIRTLVDAHEYDHGIILRALYNYFDDLNYNNLESEYNNVLQSVE